MDNKETLNNKDKDNINNNLNQSELDSSSIGLNEEQLKAATAVTGPVIVFAGAGSGKTRTLTFRVAYMILNKKISPYNILAITFTNKATNEMRERLNSFLDINAKALTINTFHSLCARILRIDIEAIGYKRDFTILDEEDQLKVISDVVKELNYDKSKAKNFQKQINYNKCFMTEPNSNDHELSKVYEVYEQRMKEENLLDYEDLLLKVYELFTKCPEVLFKYQNKYKYILVDEFQDTNLIQYKILKMLALKERNLFVVGDDDQSIYSFRGTNYGNVELFKEDFPEYQLFTLCRNYRSSQTILDVANRLISNNVNREAKQMFTDISGNADDVVIHQADTQTKEAEFIVNTIYSLKGAYNSYADFAVLYRSSVLLRNIELELIRRGIPYKVFGGVSYLRRKEIKDAIAYLKLMLNHNDLNSFKRIVNVPSRGIGEVTLKTLLQIKSTYRLNILEAIEMAETVIPKKRYSELLKLKNLIEKYTLRIESDYLLAMFDDFINEIGYVDYLKETYDNNEAEDRIANLNEFKSILLSIDAKGLEQDKIEKVREAFDEAVLSDSYLQNQNESWEGVTLSTIHSVKGLEFKYVFLIGMEDSIFPNRFRIQNDSELEEERRICYVAITRAKEKLFITHTKTRLLYGNTFSNKLSMFVNEALGTNENKDVLDVSVNNNSLSTYKKYSYKESLNVNTTNKTNITNNKMPSTINKTKIKNSNVEYKIGDEVIHSKFGEGIILGIKNGIGNIFFTKEKCSKSILLTHPSITKK